MTLSRLLATIRPTMSTTAIEYASPTTPQPRVAWFRLSLMMFLQYAVWGVWLPILSRYLEVGLGFSGEQRGWILGLAGSIGAISSPFIAGQLADRIMNAERALGLMLIIGGLVQASMTWQTSYGVWLLLSILYSVCYMPTLALTNSVAFANLTDRERQFPPIRSWGTIGWIVASVAFPLVVMQTNVTLVGYWPFFDGNARPDAVARMKYAMLVSGVLSVGYGLYCFIALPKTPPSRDTRRRLAFAAAFKLLTRPTVLPLLIAALLISMIHSLYFVHTGGYITDAIGLSEKDIGPSMAIGQVSEIVVLAALGLFLKQIGYRWILILGTLSFVGRYALFAFAPDSMTMKLAMLVHGLNYGFFFAGSFLFVERIAPADIRHSAQTVYGIIILGLGPILGSTYNQHIIGRFAMRETTASLSTLDIGPATQVVAATTLPVLEMDYRAFWLIQAGVAALAMLLLLVAFPGRTRETEAEAETIRS